LMAKLCGAKLVFLSVGAGPLYGQVGRWLVKSALVMANFRSYRDESSINSLKAIGFRTNRDRIYPDLVFSLPETAMPNNRTRENRRCVVGLGLMAYAGKYSVAEPTDAVHRQYLETLVIFAKWLLEHDYDIRLLTGDAADESVLVEFKSLLKTAVNYDEKRVINEPVQSVEQLLPQIAAADIVVATRFHNVLLAIVLDKPVIAVSFHHKCSSLMDQMGLSEYIHDINDMNADRLIGQFQDAERNAEVLKSAVRQKVTQSRKALDEQYNVIFEGRLNKAPGQQ
jgi:polysaccharide pyruvyl transferase WcaK-like protein